MLVDKEQKNRKKVLSETITATIFSFGIVSLIIYVSFHFLLNNDFGLIFNRTPEKILGAQDTNSPSNLVFLPDPKNEKAQTQITSGLFFKNILLFDNQNREFLEGITIPNAMLDIYIADKKISTTANPNGFFSVEFPKDTVQFSLVKISAFERSSQTGESTKFIIVLKHYLDRTYFGLIQRGEIFSLELDSTLKSPRDTFDEYSSFPCNFKQEIDVNDRDFDILKDFNLVIMPSNLNSLTFNENKFVAFRATNSLGKDQDKECISFLKKSESTLIWHTEQINQIIKSNSDYENQDEFLSTISSPI